VDCLILDRKDFINMSPSNLYDYKGPKSGNEETGFFNTKGRISRDAFFKRVALVILIYSCSYLALEIGLFLVFGARFYLFFETLHSSFLPLGLVVFLLIQGAKRMHDINRSGWIFLTPFYNLYLSSLSGDKGNNDYGIDPQPRNRVTYFDELDTPEKQDQPASAESEPNSSQPTNGVFNLSRNGLYLIAFVLTLGILILLNLPTDSTDSTNKVNESIVTAEGANVKNGKERGLPATQDTLTQNEKTPVRASAGTSSPKEEPISEEPKKENPPKNDNSSSSKASDNFDRVTIGKQVWMKENLAVEKFRNGETIPHAATSDAWRRAAENGVPAWCNYSNDPKKGRLYNWFAVNDPRGLAPTGWHLPSDLEWGQLITFLGGPHEDGAKAMKENEGFDAKLAGFRNPSGDFEGKGTAGRWWSSTPKNVTGARGIRLRFINQVVREEFGKGHGFSVRVVKD